MKAQGGLSIILGEVFPIEIVARTAHRYSGEYFLEINDAGGGIRVELIPRTEDISIDDVERRFRNDLLDDLLREKVRIDTANLHAALAETALRKAHPRAKE